MRSNGMGCVRCVTYLVTSMVFCDNENYIWAPCPCPSKILDCLPNTVAEFVYLAEANGIRVPRTIRDEWTNRNSVEKTLVSHCCSQVNIEASNYLPPYLLEWLRSPCLDNDLVRYLVLLSCSVCGSHPMALYWSNFCVSTSCECCCTTYCCSCCALNSDCPTVSAVAAIAVADVQASMMMEVKSFHCAHEVCWILFGEIDQNEIVISEHRTDTWRSH